MNICLINPKGYMSRTIDPELDFLSKRFATPYTRSHLGLGYLHAVLEKDGHNVITIEMMLQNMNTKEIEDIITNHNIELVGISSYTYNLHCSAYLANIIKKYHPKVFVVLGGYFPTLSTESTTKYMPAVCSVIGEGEETIRELVSKLESGADWHDVDGIAFLGQDKKIKYTKPRKLIENLDSLPFPNRIFPDKNTESVFMITSRGCYANCSYCCINAFYNKCTGNKVRRRSPENVVEEIIMLKNKYNITSVQLQDDNFGISSPNDRKWFMKFYELIKQYNIKLNYMCQFRATEVIAAPDILEKFVEIGLSVVTMGLESFVQTQLDFYNKHITVEQNLQALKIVNDLGIDYKFNLILFDPRSTIDEMIEFATTLKNIDYLFTHDNFLFPGLSVMKAFDGTAIRDYVVKNGLFYHNNMNYQFLNEEVKQCYAARTSWEESMSVFQTYIVIHEISRNLCEAQFTAQILELYKKIYYMDLDALLYICELIKGGIKNPELSELVEDRFKIEREICIKQLLGFVDHIKQYIE